MQELKLMLRIRLLRLLARNVILQEQLPENFHQISTNQVIVDWGFVWLFVLLQWKDFVLS